MGGSFHHLKRADCGWNADIKEDQGDEENDQLGKNAQDTLPLGGEIVVDHVHGDMPLLQVGGSCSEHEEGPEQKEGDFKGPNRRFAEEKRLQGAVDDASDKGKDEQGNQAAE
jgi:hypothetical protein